MFMMIILVCMVAIACIETEKKVRAEYGDVESRPTPLEVKALELDEAWKAHLAKVDYIEKCVALRKRNLPLAEFVDEYCKLFPELDDRGE